MNLLYQHRNLYLMEEAVESELTLDLLELKSCETCGRTFNPKSLERHEKICVKTKSSHRNVFNSFLQRAKETGAVPATAVDNQNEKGKKIKWKEEHENLINIVRSKSGPSKSVSSFNRSVPLKSFSTATGYIQCPTCTRYFNQKAADRHMSWCQEQQSRMPKTPLNNEALERLKARIKYQAPLPGQKKSKDNARLIKSADFLRGSSILRTHSSPPVSGRNLNGLKCSSTAKETTLLQRRKSLDKNSLDINNKKSMLLETKKVVKFKEKFPDYDKKRNTCDMLKALRLQLSKLDTCDNFEDSSYGTSVNEHFIKNNNVTHKFDKPVEVQCPWSSTEEVLSSNSSSSDGSLPSLSRGGSSERRLPRFCYNCGTKYPIVSAKFCCECGARRLIIGTNNNYLQP